MTNEEKLLEQIDKARNRIHIQCICNREELIAGYFRSPATFDSYEINEHYRKLQNKIDFIFDDLRMYIEEVDNA